MDLNNSDANFHYRLKELLEERDFIIMDKSKLVRPDQNSLSVMRECNPKETKSRILIQECKLHEAIYLSANFQKH